MFIKCLAIYFTLLLCSLVYLLSGNGQYCKLDSLQLKTSDNTCIQHVVIPGYLYE